MPSGAHRSCNVSPPGLPPTLPLPLQVYGGSVQSYAVNAHGGEYAEVGAPAGPRDVSGGGQGSAETPLCCLLLEFDTGAAHGPEAVVPPQSSLQLGLPSSQRLPPAAQQV